MFTMLPIVTLATRNDHDFKEVVLQFEMSKLTLVDLWSLISPKLAIKFGKLDQIKQVLPTFQPGWLTSDVSIVVFRNVFHLFIEGRFALQLYRSNTKPICCAVYACLKAESNEEKSKRE